MRACRYGSRPLEWKRSVLLMECTAYFLVVLLFVVEAELLRVSNRCDSTFHNREDECWYLDEKNVLWLELSHVPGCGCCCVVSVARCGMYQAARNTTHRVPFSLRCRVQQARKPCFLLAGGESKASLQLRMSHLLSQTGAARVASRCTRVSVGWD